LARDAEKLTLVIGKDYPKKHLNIKHMNSHVIVCCYLDPKKDAIDTN